jgi:hypothetical protein
MWKCNRFQQTLRELSAHELVGEIILIDNTTNDLKIELPKLIHILEGKNTYVNPAWNKGVKLAKYDKLLILNDDIWMDWRILNSLYDVVTSEIGLIGLDENAINIEKTEEVFGLELTPNRNGGFGCCMFVHKENYSTIPNDMKIWGGDDWLFVNCLNKIKNNYKLVGFKIEGEMSVTCNQSEFNPIKQNDLQLKEKYKLIVYY